LEDTKVDELIIASTIFDIEDRKSTVLFAEVMKEINEELVHPK
jgi:hypothetical protein